MRRAVFLDRDGVLTRSMLRNGVPSAPLVPEDMEIYPEAAAALDRLKAAGFVLVCVSNQPEMARGNLTAGAAARMETALRAALPLDDVLVCPHDDAARCECRKPLPGMLLAAAARHGIDLSRSWMVGDRWRDVDAGAAAGCRTIFLDRGYGERPPAHSPDGTAASIEQAADQILQK